MQVSPFRLPAIVALLILAAGPLHADGPPRPAWAGVWQGRIGDRPVQVCLQHRADDDLGAYYDRRDRRIISLGTLASGRHAQPTTMPVWTESPDTDHPEDGPLWRLAGVAGGHLTGTWTDGRRTLPIALAAVAVAPPPADDPPDEFCGSLAFNLPRYTAPVIARTHARLDGTGYERLTVDAGTPFGDDHQPAVTTFQLPATTPAIARVNAALRQDIPTGPGDDINFQCSMSQIAATGSDGGASSWTVPEIITSRWLVSRNDSASDCGGPHPNTATSYTTWDLRSGTRVAPEDWFTAAALTRTVDHPGARDALVTITYTPAFRALIEAAYARARGDDAECLEVARDADEWDAHLVRDGIAFYPSLPHVTTACAENAVIPFTELDRYLNTPGRAAIASFRAESAVAK